MKNCSFSILRYDEFRVQIYQWYVNIDIKKKKKSKENKGENTMYKNDIFSFDQYSQSTVINEKKIWTICGLFRSKNRRYRDTEVEWALENNRFSRSNIFEKRMNVVPVLTIPLVGHLWKDWTRGTVGKAMWGCEKKTSGNGRTSWCTIFVLIDLNPQKIDVASVVSIWLVAVDQSG